MNNSFILLSRSILDSEVFASQKMLKIWVWCLCKANYKSRNVPLKVGRGERIIKVKRGQFIFGRFRAEDELFIDGSTIYKLIKKLEEIGNISIESSNQYSIITILNYDYYQDPKTYEVAADKPDNNETVATLEPDNNTTKKENKEKKENNILNKDKKEKSEISEKEVVVNPLPERDISTLMQFKQDATNITLAVIEDHMTDEQKEERVKVLTKELLQPGFNFDAFMKATGLSEEDAKFWMKEYIKHIRSSGEYCNPLSVIRKHYTNWVKIKIKQDGEKKSDSKTWSGKLKSMGGSNND